MDTVSNFSVDVATIFSWLCLFVICLIETITGTLVTR